MTTSESSQSVHFLCLKNCKVPSDSNSSTSSSDPSKSPTNNNNPTISNSNTVHLKCAPNTGLCAAIPVNEAYSSPRIINYGTPLSNAHCSSNQVSNCNNCEVETSGTEDKSFSCDRDLNCSGKDACLKITENHLSTKALRNKLSPYVARNSKTRAVEVPTTFEVKKNQDSNHSQVNFSSVENTGESGSSGLTATGCFIPTCEEDQVMLENVTVNHNCIRSQDNNISSSAQVALLSGGIPVSVNSICSDPGNNMVIKREQNGNSIELTLDNQYHHNNRIHHNHFQALQSTGSNSVDCCVSHSIGGESLVNSMQPHDGFLGALNNHHNTNCNPPSSQVCHNGLFVSPCAHNCGGISLAAGNGSMGSSNGAGSMASPGSLVDCEHDHDCDDDKAINGDTFATGDLPDPDAIKMFVGQIPKHFNETELRTLFEEYGRVFQINVLRDKVSKQSKGCCFVTFYTRKSAMAAQNALHNVKTLPGMNHRMQVKPADNENRYERKLFVGMIARKCTEADVKAMFSRFGEIDECTVLRDSQNQSKGCAFVTFDSKQSAQIAIKAVHHSTTMEGCSSKIVVKFADTQKDKDQRRQQTHLGNLSTTAVTPLSQPQPILSSLTSLSGILKCYKQMLQQLQQATQTAGYYSQLSPLSGLGGLGFGSGGGGALGSSTTSSDFAALAALFNAGGQHLINPLINQSFAALGNHSSLSPTGANGCSLGSTNSLNNGNGLSSGLSSFGAIRSQPVTHKQVRIVTNEGPEGANLFIYHLPPEAGDLDLAQMFIPYGNVISAKVFVDKVTNLSKCFGFVSYDSPVSAQLAIHQMNGFQIGMKRLKVQLKKPKDAAKPY